MEYPPDTRHEIDQNSSIEETAISGFFDAQISAAKLAGTLLEYIFQEGVGGEADKRYRRGLQDTIAGVARAPKGKRGERARDQSSDLRNEMRRNSDDAAFYAFVERLTYIANLPND